MTLSLYKLLLCTTPVLLCATKYYYSSILPRTTKYHCSTNSGTTKCSKCYSSTTPCYKVILQYTIRNYKVLIQYYKVLLQYYSVLLQYYSVLQSTTPVLICTTKKIVLFQYYKKLFQYYFVLLFTTQYYILQYYSSNSPVLLCTTKYYSVIQSTNPVLLCTTQYYSNTTPYKKVLLQHYAVLFHYYPSTTLLLLCYALQVFLLTLQTKTINQPASQPVWPAGR